MAAYGRFCEGCGSKMPPFFPRTRDDEGNLICSTCRDTKTAAQNAAASHYLRYQANTLDQAIQTAIEQIPIQQSVVRPESQTGYTIVDKGGSYHVYKDSAWMEPTGNLLPWSAPTGIPVARVGLDGGVTHISTKKVAHDSGDGETIFHCPFCGAGQVIGRSDGTVECQFCDTAFTVQVQPQQSAQPQTIEGEPHLISDMPEDSVAGEEIELDPEDTEIDMDDLGTDPSSEGNPFMEQKKNPFVSYRTLEGADLSEGDYIRHLAIHHAADRDRVIAEVRASLKEG